jgi:hypothetical protein
VNEVQMLLGWAKSAQRAVVDIPEKDRSGYGTLRKLLILHASLDGEGRLIAMVAHPTLQ